MAEHETADATPDETPDVAPDETQEEKRERVMRRLAEIIRAGPPDLSGSGSGSGPVSTGGLPLIPADADQFDQESAARLLAELAGFFARETRQAGGEGAERE